MNILLRFGDMLIKCEIRLYCASIKKEEKKEEKSTESKRKRFVFGGTFASLRQTANFHL